MPAKSEVSAQAASPRPWARGTMCKLLVLLVLATLLPLVAVQSIFLYRAWKLREDRELQANLTAAKALAGELKERLKGIVLQQNALAQAVAALPTQEADKLNFLLSFATSQSESVIAMHWADSQGIVVASSDDSTLGHSFADEPFLNAAAAGDIPVISNLMHGDTKTYFMLCTPIENDGYVIAEIDPRLVVPRGSRTTPLAESTMVLYDSDHRIAFCQSHPTIQWESQQVAHSSMLDAATRGSETAGIYHSDLSGQTVVAAFAPIAETGWVVEVSRSRRSAMAVMTESIQMAVIVSAASVCVSVAMAALISRYISRGFQHLQLQAEAIGKGRFETAAYAPRIAELKELAASFDEMAASLAVLERQRENDMRLLREAAESLRRSEEEFRALANVVPQLVWTASPEAQITYVNDRYAEYTGQTFRQPDDWQKVVHPDDVDETIVQVQQAMQKSSPFTIMHRLLRKDGAYRWHLSRAMPLCDNEGRAIKYFGTETDIHDVKEAQDRLQASEERIRLFIERAPAAIAVLDSQMRYILASRRWKTDFGLGETDLTGKSHYEVFPEITDEWKELHRRCLAGEVLSRDEDKLVRSNGTVDWLKWEIRPWRTIEGEVGGMIILSEVITARKKQREALLKAAKELARSNRELEQFAYVASHDLQEPLRIVVSYMDLLQRRHGAELSSEAKEFANFAIDGAKRMQALVQGLLTYSRVGRQAPKRECFNAGEAVDRVMANLKETIAESQADVSRGEMPSVSANRIQLEQVFGNLISNALKFRSPQRRCRIRIEGHKKGDMCEFSVADNGIGMEPSQAQRIFQIFQRLHTAAEYPGTGIGLSICKRIIDIHGGRIWVETAPDKGSTFRFTLASC
jgi:PAS domain S-box-containing protein